MLSNTVLWFKVFIDEILLTLRESLLALNQFPIDSGSDIIEEQN